jgi:RNA polymerase sigma factor (sigma-70 family)
MHVPFARWAGARGGPVLDLGSGGGGHVRTMFEAARKEGAPMPAVTLSDLHPNVDACRRLKDAFPGRMEYVTTMVNATDTGPREARLFSICAAFHHFAPPEARRVLENAARHADGLFIAEVTTRSWLSAIAPLACIVPLMIACLFARRVALRKIAITALVPVVPLMIVFDGIVSALRSYRVDEILAMLPARARRDWRWEAGSQRYLGLLRAPFVFGYRKRECAGGATLPGNARGRRGEAVGERAEREQMLAAIRRALLSMPVEECRLLALRYGAGLTLAEIARALAISCRRVPARLRNALRRLRSALTSGGYPAGQNPAPRGDLLESAICSGADAPAGLRERILKRIGAR